MPELTDLNIANNIQDLERLAWSEKLRNCKKSQTLENALKTLYQEIFRGECDQEKCFILCLRYLFAIEKLCKIGDAKFVKIKYSHEISRVDNKVEELRPILEKWYEELAQQKKQKRKALPNKILTKDPELSTTKEEPLFPDEYISTKQLFRAIQNENNILIVDIRPANEYKESEIQFDNVINIPEDIIAAGLSANVVGTKLNDGTKELWDKRDNFTALVFLDWNSGPDHVTSTKLNYLKASVVEWDCLRQYKQHPVILNGGFKEFIDTYPGCVTNVHVNFVRNNEDIDELLELDGITYPESDQNVSTMPLKQFTIEELEESVKIDESSDEEIEEKKDDISSDSISLDSTPEEKEIPILPKGGGASLDRPSVELAKDENIDEIKNKIEEERLQILLEARNMKNKPSSKPVVHTDNKKKFIEEYVGDRPENKPKVVPPIIRRDTKPKRQEFVFGGWCGLVNIKNTCYMSTVLQCLKCIPVVSAFVHSNFEKFITRRPPQIIYEFASVIKKLCEGTESDKKSYRPQSFYDAICRLDPIYKKGKHEDCMEFFSLFI